MRRWAVLILCSQLVLCGCNTTKLLKKQKLQLLTAEFNTLQSTNVFLSANPNPEVLGQSSVFVSVATLNNVLKVADKVEAPIPSISGAVLHIETVRTQFADGFPQLAVVAWAKKGSLKLDLTVSAAIEPVIDSGDPSKMKFKVHVLNVVPVAHWCIFNFKVWRFVRDLLQVKLQEYVDLMPEFSLPLRSKLGFTNPARSQTVRSSAPDGYVDGVVQIPGFSYDGTLVVDRTLFLTDGIHVYVSIH